MREKSEKRKSKNSKKKSSVTELTENNESVKKLTQKSTKVQIEGYVNSYLTTDEKMQTSIVQALMLNWKDYGKMNLTYHTLLLSIY